jgi:hypothetical protein
MSTDAIAVIKTKNDLKCVENLKQCDSLLLKCEETIDFATDLIDSKDLELKYCNSVQVAQQNQIDELTEQAAHSHIPHVAATSGFWVLILILL